MLNKPGIYDIPEKDYHADPCPLPSLSASFAKKMLMQSPLHAMLEHPRLNPGATHSSSKPMDFGSVCHELLLGAGAGIRVIQFNDYRKKEAQEQRDEAHAAGITPVLEKDYERALRVVAAMREQIANHHDAKDGFAGRTEQTLIWQEDNGIWCRARLDGLADNWVDDYKTTEGSANPEGWAKQLFTMGYDIQNAFYLRGCRKLGLQPQGFRFFVQEVKDEPYAMSVIAIDPYGLEQAEEKVEHAIKLYAECLKSGIWPCYPAHTCWVTPPVYIDKAWTDRTMRQKIYEDDGKTYAQAMNAYAPNQPDALTELLGE